MEPPSRISHLESIILMYDDNYCEENQHATQDNGCMCTFFTDLQVYDFTLYLKESHVTETQAQKQTIH